MSVAEHRDVVGRPLDERRAGSPAGHICKVLRLLLRSNAVLYEWLVSPVVSVDAPLRGERRQHMREDADRHYRRIIGVGG